MRGPMNDGSPYRNRSGEQRLGYTGGNPNMPIYNQAAMPQFNSGMPQPGNGAIASGPQQMQVAPFPYGRPGAIGPGVSGAQQMQTQPMPSKPMLIHNNRQRRAVLPIIGGRYAY